MAILLIPIVSCVAEQGIKKGQTIKDGVNVDMKINITVNNKVLTALLYDNTSTKALIDLLKKGDVTIDMHDYGNFEKVGELPVSLPRNDKHIKTDAGDLILYLGKRFVIYYDKNE